MAWKHALKGMRSGAWLTRARLRFWVFALLTASAAGLIILVVTSDGRNDAFDRPLGTDFSNFYAAGTSVREGRPAQPFDPAAHHARQKELFGPNTPFYGWPYPPFFLFVTAALALMPYPLALAVWQGVTLAIYLLAMRVLVSVACGQTQDDRSGPPAPAATSDATAQHPWRDPLFLGLALAYPAVFVNLGHGQNGFLTAALLAGGLALLDRRPAISGILFGLMIYKPQFGLMIPVALVAGGRWRVFAAAAVTCALLLIATLVVFGPETWRAFFVSAATTRSVLLEAGDTGWHKLQGVFPWVRAWGGAVPLAYAAQGAATLAAAAVVVILWRGPARPALKGAALAVATLVAAPQSLDYDLMILAPAIALMAADGLTRGFRDYEKTALAAIWLAPLIARQIAEHTRVPIGAIAMLAMMLLVFRRAAMQSDAVGCRASHVAR
jgi:hypothetical protein